MSYNANPLRATSLNWTEDGRIICGGEEKVTLLDQTLQTEKRCTIGFQYLDCVDEVENGYIITVRHKNESFLQLLSSEMLVKEQPSTKLCGLQKNKFSKTMHHILVVNRLNKSIDVYDRTTYQKTMIIKVDIENLGGIHAMYDNTVVVSGESQVRLYKICAGAQPIWTLHTGKKNPSAITSDSRGFIYVTSMLSNKIDVLSMEGKGKLLAKRTT